MKGGKELGKIRETRDLGKPVDFLMTLSVATQPVVRQRVVG